MAISYTITQSGSTVSYTVNPGVGPKGDTGATGATGPAGPNTVSTTTSTDITGILKGNGATVSAAVAGTDYAAASHTHVSSAITDATDDGSTNQGKILKTDASGQVKASGIYADLTGGIGLMAGDPDVAVGNFAIFTGNNITGQRSLYCPNATGTLALTAQTDGTIRATDLDFANTTDIGADLADADEILIADGGGNTARRKSALSRVWTYISGKLSTVAVLLTGNQTVAGNKTFSGQTELTGQAASSGTSAMTRDLSDARYQGRIFISGDQMRSFGRSSNSITQFASGALSPGYMAAAAGLRDGQNDYIAAPLPINLQGKSITLNIYWSRNGGTPTNTDFDYRVLTYGVNNSGWNTGWATSPPSGGASLDVAETTASFPTGTIAGLRTSHTFTIPANYFCLTINRRGSNVTDTLDTELLVWGIEIVPN